MDTTRNRATNGIRPSNRKMVTFSKQVTAAAGGKQIFLASVLYVCCDGECNYGDKHYLVVYPVTAYNLRRATEIAKRRFPEAISLTVESP
jgi:hypothetical protein